MLFIVGNMEAKPFTRTRLGAILKEKTIKKTVLRADSGAEQAGPLRPQQKSTA